MRNSEWEVETLVWCRASSEIQGTRRKVMTAHEHGGNITQVWLLDVMVLSVTRHSNSRVQMIKAPSRRLVT